MLVSVDPANGTQRWRINTGKPLSAGVGADAVAVAVGTDKGDVLAFDISGKPLWQTKITSEVSGPPKPTDGIVIVWSLDGRIFGLSETDGARKWVYQRPTPPLTVRRYAGGVVTRGGLFTGTPGGKLLGINVATGALAWEGNVATPKGATELERLADITSLPVVEERQVCAAAYLGRVACYSTVANINVVASGGDSRAGRKAHAMLLAPVVLFVSALKPWAVLLFAVFFWRAPEPLAVLLTPLLLPKRALTPLAVLPPPPMLL